LGSVGAVPSSRPLSPAAGPWSGAGQWSHAAVVGSWDGRAVHVWGWDGQHTLPVAWLYRSFRSAPWPGSPLASGQLSSIEIALTPTERVRPTTARLDPVGAAGWLTAVGGEPHPGDSLAWLRDVAVLATRAVDAARVLPAIASERGTVAARWRPVLDAGLDAVLDALATSMPPILLASDPQPDPAAATGDIFASLVDGVARDRLAGRWRAPAVAAPKATAAAARALFAGLARPDSMVRVTGASTGDELARLGERLERLARRARGEPVVVPRVRLTVPEDPFDDWHVALEVVDEADPGRWCSADDVWDATPLALELAGDPRYLGHLAAVVVEAAEAAAKVVAPLADLAGAHEPATVELDLDAAETFLEQAPAELAALGIALIGPERLVKADLGVRGRATPAPPDDRPGGFGRDAIVQWSMTVLDGEAPTALAEAELARAAAAGATLLHTGRRWVRIDPEAMRRARHRLDLHRRDHQVVDAVTLLRLAADADTELLADAGRPGVGGDEREGRAGRDGGDDRGWAGDLLSGLPDDALEEVREPASFTGTLRPYQRRGLSWLRFLARLGLGGCLADDMGLGKTATTLAHLLDRPGPHLVVCPLSVVHNWEAEARRFAPSLRVLVHHGTGRAGRGDDAQARLDGVADDRPPELTITTYGLLARDVAHLAATEWSTVVLDEAQMIKNPGTNAARAVRVLRAAQKVALTGTPVENRLSELWAILDAVNPGLLGSRERFRHRFAKPIERDGDELAAARLRRLTQPFVLRRTKADRQLVPDLPDKIEQIAWAALTREQAVLYQQVVDQLLEHAAHAAGMKRRGLVLAALTRLKQICNHPVHVLGDGSRLAGRSGKLARFDELVDELLDLDERALVFTQFREMGDLLQRHLAERLGMRAPFLHGGVARARRDAMVAGFQAGHGPPLLLVSLKAGGTGLNLTAASQVIHYDRWWNPAVEDQATDRAWRIGQGRTVNVHKLVCEGTVEERIATLIDDKRVLANVVVGTGEAWLSDLSTAELRELVRLDAGGGS
jgi:hypothetical protein